MTGVLLIGTQTHGGRERARSLYCSRHHVHTHTSCLETHCLLWNYMVDWGVLCLNWVMQNWEKSVGDDAERVGVKNLYS